MNRLILRIAACAFAGTAGCAAGDHIAPGLGGGPFFGALAAAPFALVSLGRCEGAGGVMLWTAAYAFVLWVATSASGHLADAFPRLARDVVCVGLPAGLTTAVLDTRFRTGRAAPFSLARALVGGGGAGIIGAWAFGAWMARVHYFPLIAGIVQSTSATVGMLVHFAIGVAIGMTFGMLFQREIRGLGSSVAFGAAYGLVWWFVGPLTVLPLLTHHRIDWSASYAAANFGSLVGHAVYGMIVGVTYAVLDRLWRRLFYESDPLNRQAAGIGGRTASALARGALASLGGGLVFGGIMSASGVLPRVASLIGGTSGLVGFVVHMAIGTLIGASYGFLYAYEAPSVTAALAWGMVYGAIWWFAGALTLFPILLGGSFAWTIATARAELPSLLGHLVYGAATAVAFLILERRHVAWIESDPRVAARERKKRRPLGTAAPACSLFFVGISVVIPAVVA